MIHSKSIYIYIHIYSTYVDIHTVNVSVFEFLMLRVLPGDQIILSGSRRFLRCFCKRGDA